MTNDSAKPTATGSPAPRAKPSAPSESGSFIVEWYRPQRKQQIIAVFAVATVLVLIGVTLVGLVHADRIATGGAARWAVSLFGALCVMGGPITAVVGLPIAAGGDSYLAIRGDGVLFKQRKELLFAGWNNLADVSVSDQRAIVLALTEGEPVIIEGRFMDVTTDELVQRIKRAQQRALMGLLKPPPRPRASPSAPPPTPT